MVSSPPIVPLGQSSTHVKMCVVAGTGFGKTVFSATAPNALHLITDPEGTESAVNVGVGQGNKEWLIDNWDQGPSSMTAAYEYMVAEGCDKFDWLIHDTVSAENDLCMQRAMDIMRARGTDNSGKYIGKQDYYVPDKPQYLRTQQAFMEMTKMFHALPINQIWLAWPRKMEMVDPETDETTEVFTAGIQNDYVAEKFLGLMKVIGYGVARKGDGGKTTRRMYFSQRGMYRGKDRYNALGNFKDDLDVPRMMEIIEAKKSGAPRRAAKKATPRRRSA